ncbi:hypothetical protein AB0K43_24255 [Kitasatospora sp. NPDC049258]|uniref:hypothetical protein n=1 Tax=Kitasatospora sp. NPDC049258 TaxID=3155394 RepID=UPI0034490724
MARPIEEAVLNEQWSGPAADGGNPGVRRLLEGAAAVPDGAPCPLCDRPVDPSGAAVVDGAVVDGVRIDGPGSDLHTAVRAHSGCGPSRVWAPAQIAAARVRLGLPEAAAWRPDDRPRGADRLEPGMSGRPGEELPSLLFHPGAPYPGGLLGHLADRYTEGLAPLDLTGVVPAQHLPGWTVHAVAGRITAIGCPAGPWWANPGGHPTTLPWRRAGQAERRILLAVLPPEEPVPAPGDLAALGRAIRAGLVLGGVAALSGTFF